VQLNLQGAGKPRLDHPGREISRIEFAMDRAQQHARDLSGELAPALRLSCKTILGLRTARPDADED